MGRASSFASSVDFEQKGFVSGHSIRRVPVSILRNNGGKGSFLFCFYFALFINCSKRRINLSPTKPKQRGRRGEALGTPIWKKLAARSRRSSAVRMHWTLFFSSSTHNFPLTSQVISVSTLSWSSSMVQNSTYSEYVGDLGLCRSEQRADTNWAAITKTEKKRTWNSEWANDSVPLIKNMNILNFIFLLPWTWVLCMSKLWEFITENFHWHWAS